MTWILDPAHSAVTFTAKHMMITTVRGSMKIADVDLHFDPDNHEASSVRVSLDAASIDTGQDARDQHLRSDDFLNADEFPTIDFVSTSIERNGNDRSGKIHGDLTIRGTTRRSSSMPNSRALSRTCRVASAPRSVPAPRSTETISG